MNTDVFRFGPFELNVREHRLVPEGSVIPLRGKVFATLRLLVESAGSLVPKEELLRTLWPDTAVEENNLNHNISLLRKMLGEKATVQAYRNHPADWIQICCACYQDRRGIRAGEGEG